MQSYKITDVASVRFDSEGPASEVQEVREHARETAVFVTIPAGVGGAAGAGSEIITEGDQVKVPSETLDFSLEQSVSVPVQPN